MSPKDCFRLLVLCFWLLVVNCENTQRAYVLRVQVGQAPMVVHNDNRDYKRWSEPPIFRIPASGYKTSSVDRGQSGNIYSAQEDHTTDSKSSQIPSHYNFVMPETQNSNVPKSQVNHFKFGFNSASLTRRQSTVVYNRSENKTPAFPDGQKIHQANAVSVFSAGAVQVPPRIYHARTKSTGGFTPVQVDKAPVVFGPNSRKALIYSHSSTASPISRAIKSSLKSESHKIHVNPSTPNMHTLHQQESRLTTRPEVSGYHSAYGSPHSFNYDRTNLLQKVLKPTDTKTDSIVKGHSLGSNSARKVDTQMSYPRWSPRSHSSDVMSEVRGYAHVCHLRPGFDKTYPQASSAAGRKFLETGFPSVKQNQGSSGHDLTKLGFGVSVPALSERQLNLNYNSRGSQPSSWHHPPLPPDRAQIPVQGKFKPFQRLRTNDDIPAHTNSSDSETAPTQTFAGTTLPPSLNSTGITSSVVPSVTGEFSTKSASPMQAEGRDAKLAPQASNREDQSDSSAEVGPSLDQNKQVTISPPNAQPAETERKDDGVVSSPPETDQSGV